jgi:hypothetical protein
MTEYEKYTSVDEYPAQCDVTVAELNELQRLFYDPDSEYGKQYDEFPATDSEGNVYPIFYSPDDLTVNANLTDDNYAPYPPFNGNLEPGAHDHDDGIEMCNAPLNKWRERYPDIRYCGCITYDGQTFCTNHSGRIDPSDVATMNMTDTDQFQSAEELMQTGLFTQTIDHFYANLSGLKKLVGWGTFESLMGESTYEFGVEYETREFDFSDTPHVTDTDDTTTTVKCGFPTQHVDPALSLYVAAMMSVQMITVQPRIMYEDPTEGERMMETQTVEQAQLTAPTDGDPVQEFKTLETWSEHHLNLPLSRLVRDRPQLLERGGVSIGPGDETETIDEDDVVLEIQADPDDVETSEGGTDPNAFDEYTAPSEEITAKIDDAE